MLQRSFEDLHSSKIFAPKIHLRLHLWSILNSRRIFEASKILGQRFWRFLGKKSLFVEEILTKNRQFMWWKLRKIFMFELLIEANTIGHFLWYIILELRIFIYNILLKIFDSSKIFEEITIFEGLRRFFKNYEESLSSSLVYFPNPKILRLFLWSIFNLRCNTACLIQTPEPGQQRNKPLI